MNNDRRRRIRIELDGTVPEGTEESENDSKNDDSRDEEHSQLLETFHVHGYRAVRSPEDDEGTGFGNRLGKAVETGEHDSVDDGAGRG